MRNILIGMPTKMLLDIERDIIYDMNVAKSHQILVELAAQKRAVEEALANPDAHLGATEQ